MDRSMIYPRLPGSAEALILSLELRDPHTRFHCDQVVRLAMELGEACEVLNNELDYLRISARFHDIGKIGIPDAILLKPAHLTPSEWLIMREHAERGERILNATSLPDHDAIASIIRHHHESFDGSGYPDGLRGESIPLLSRIILIVDAYDAMSNPRPYHKERNHAEIMGILYSENGKKFDPQVFREFSMLIEHSPARIH